MVSIDVDRRCCGLFDYGNVMRSEMIVGFEANHLAMSIEFGIFHRIRSIAIVSTTVVIVPSIIEQLLGHFLLLLGLLHIGDHPKDDTILLLTFSSKACKEVDDTVDGCVIDGRIDLGDESSLFAARPTRREWQVLWTLIT